MPKVLVVDDSVVIRKMAELLLTEAGLQVVLTASVDEAIAFLSKERPDAVVTDISMPGKNGYEVCSFVRSQAALAGTAVLVVSAIINEEVVKKASACGADAVLKKPFQGTALKDRVMELLAKKQPPAPAAAAPPPAQPAAGPESSAKLKELEEGLEQERGKVARLAERLDGLEKGAGRAKELEAALEIERKKSAELSEKVVQLTAQVEELEATVSVEREAAAQIIQRLNDPQRPDKGKAA